jgi:hypothetical protein
MSINKEEWAEYEEYLETLTESELEIEINWLKSVGMAKQRGSVVSCIEINTLQ